jgi:cysteine desulfurase
VNQPIYLDFAAASPLDKTVSKAMEPYLNDRFYNPSAIYKASKRVKQNLESARAAVAQIIGARPVEIIFTAGGTEANNLAIDGIMNQFPTGRILTSAVEHESVLVPAGRFERKLIAVDTTGRVNPADLDKLIDDQTMLVSVMLANNEIGTVQPVGQIGAIISRVRQQRQKTGNQLPIYFHSDATQAANYLDLHTAKLGVDLMTLNGGKIYGPKQSGILFVSKDVSLQPIILGGGQERGWRSGTENVPADIGFTAALGLAQSSRKTEALRLAQLQQQFFELLTKNFPRAFINGSQRYRLPNNVHVTFTGTDNERLLYELDRRGVMAATGSACNASNLQPSHVLSAIGLTDEQARSSVRFTMGRSTTSGQINQTVRILTGLVK